MCELLWSDPQPEEGRSASKRGVGVSFGADVTRTFLKANNLDLLVRSHEVRLLNAHTLHPSLPNDWTSALDCQACRAHHLSALPCLKRHFQVFCSSLSSPHLQHSCFLPQGWQCYLCLLYV